jgi:carboxypeptidase Q
MSRRGLWTLGLVIVATTAQSQTATAPAPAVTQRAVGVPSNDDLVARMIQEGTQRSHVDADLQYLVDVIGPRLTGSPEMRRANDWTRQKFVEYGVDRAELEPWSFGIGWTRGPMTLRMLAPQHRELLGVSWAWSPGTKGPVAGDVVFMDARTQSDYDRRFAGKLRGAWVMLGPAYSVVNAAAPPLTSADSARHDTLARALAPHTRDEVEFFNSRVPLLAREGAAGAIHDGGKQFGLFTMAGSPAYVSPIPQIVIGNDNYAQLERLARRGEHTRIEVDISNTFTRDTLEAWNTVAEIRGSEKPNEVVLLGAHLDSWDLATGSTDNAAGAIAVLEAARILTASGVHPKRTIRFALFSGEEEGLFGSQEYAMRHERELDNFQTVLVLDNGTGRITAMAVQGREELRDMWKAMLQPVASLGQLIVRSGIKTGTDHLAFAPYGVPVFNYDQLTRGYDHTHHSQVDDYSHSVPSDIAQAATIMAVNAWQFADLDQLLPRGPRTR